MFGKNKKQNINFQLRKKVFVGMSGGVDSSLSAALLKKQGYDVTGVFIKVWQPEFVKCSWREDRIDAMRICAELGIPFLDLDLEKEYKEEVFDYMITEYREGRTPNPDVMCNKSIKFGGFLKFALKNGADFVATGHYSQKFIKSIKSKDKITYHLMAGRDKNKDQTYFLWTLTPEQMKYILFPIGDLVKNKVRKLAKKYNLLTATKKDSQGLCFVGEVDMKEFLKRFLPEKIGDVLDEKGEVIGQHEGAYYFTIGQRHGFLITKKTPKDKPYFVIEKNVIKNTITVSMKVRKETVFDKKEVLAKDINWITGNAPDMEKQYQARIRYRQPLQNCKIYKNSSSTEIKIVFEKAQKSISAGQSIVFYNKEECLGGGIIQ